MVSINQQAIRVLIADNDPLIRSTLQNRLMQQGYSVGTAASGSEALRLFALTRPHLVIQDVLLPGIDGFQLLARIRALSDAPVLLLSALSSIADRITGLQLGADDYFGKPFSASELDARIRALLRRTARHGSTHSQSAATPAPQTVLLGNLRVDCNRRQAFRGDEKLHLTELEFRLLEVLIEGAGQPISRVELIRRVWGFDPASVSVRRIVDSHISRLRAKLEEHPDDPELIHTVRGLGYSMRRHPADSEAMPDARPNDASDLAAWRARQWGVTCEQH
jgi:OmpR family response regulator RpaB